jgi:hypothetical protein
MAGRRRSPSPRWSRRRMLALLAAAGLTVVVLVAGVVLAVVQAVDPSSGESTNPVRTGGSAGDEDTSVPTGTAALDEAHDSLAARPMPSVPVSASRPGPLSERDPGAPIVLPPPTGVGPAGVPTGFPHTPEGAMAQLAAIDQSALQSGSLNGARAVISAWTMPGGPTTTSWSGVRAMRALLEAAGLPSEGSGQLAIVLTPLMGQVKGAVGPDFVIPCVDFELAVTLLQTARGATADCQRMVWQSDRWLIGPGKEPAVPPSVWPGTELALSVGYRELRRG